MPEQGEKGEWVAHEASGATSKCENCRHWATKLAHAYQENERLKRVAVAASAVLSEWRDFTQSRTYEFNVKLCKLRIALDVWDKGKKK